VLQIVQHVLNQGTAASSECRFLVARGISSADVSAPLLQTQVPGLDPNETWDVADLSASIWNDVGTHYLNCRIDSANEVRESDEGNNTTSIKIVCVAPDLVIPPLTINGVECLDGDVLTVSKGTVLNIGQRVRNIGTSASSECRLYTAWGASPTDFSHFLVAARISGLNPAATSERVALTSYTWDQTGTYYLNSRVDDLSEVDESDEGNNTISVTIVAE
jgi:subtilase family serine protease